MIEIFGVKHVSSYFSSVRDQVLYSAHQGIGKVIIGIELGGKGKGNPFFVRLEKELEERLKKSGVKFEFVYLDSVAARSASYKLHLKRSSLLAKDADVGLSEREHEALRRIMAKADYFDFVLRTGKMRRKMASEKVDLAVVGAVHAYQLERFPEFAGSSSHYIGIGKKEIAVALGEKISAMNAYRKRKLARREKKRKMNVRKTRKR